MAIKTSLQGARVLVTGGGMGLGKLLACGAAQRGASVTVWDRDAERAEAVRDIILGHGCEAAAATVDVTDRARVAEAAREAGPIDVLVNNAGVVAGRALLETTDSSIDRTLDVNLRSLFGVTREFLGGMVERDHGAVVTVASAAALAAPARMTDYAASKFGAYGFNEALRGELRQAGARVNTLIVCPYYMDTGMFDGVRTKVPWLLPILDPKRVAIKVLDGIERGHQQLILPPFVRLTPLMRMLPPAGFDFMADLFGINDTMTEFTGRPGDRV